MSNDVTGVTGHGKIAFELLPGTGYRLGSSAIVQTTIIDNEAPQVNIPDNPLPESDNIPRNFNITSTNRPSGSEVNVTFEVDEKASTATFETDYRISNLTFGPSTRSGSFILSDRSNTHRLYLNAKRDTEVELNETIVVIFTSPNAVFANDLNTYAHTFTINDDDDATIIPNNVAVPSSASTFSIDLNLASLSGQNISIDVVDNNPATTADDTDYDITSTSPLTISPGDSKATITGTILPSATITGEEKIVLDLTATNAIFDDESNTGTATVTLSSLPVISLNNTPESVTQGRTFRL